MIREAQGLKNLNFQMELEFPITKKKLEQNQFEE